MKTFDDLLEYELGEEVQLFNAPRQNPRNNNRFETGTKGKITEFFENGLMIETDKGEQIRIYLPAVVCKCKNKADANPREKRIADLKQQLAISEHDREHNDYELTEVYKKIAELKRENAELKGKLEAMTADRNRWMNVDKEDCGYLREAKEKLEAMTADRDRWMNADCGHLKEAKEIIENLLGLMSDEVLHHDYYKRTYIDPATQFLSKEIKNDET